jgi:hypothetical protein
MISSQGQARRAQRDGDDILLAFREWLSQEARAGRVTLHPQGRDEAAARKEFHASPSIAAVEPAIEPGDGPPPRRRSAGRRLFRTIAYGFVVAVIAGGAFAWQSYGDDKSKEAVAAWGLNLLGSMLGSGSSSSRQTVVASIANPADQTPAEDAAVPQAMSAVQAPPAPVDPVSPELQQKLDAMVNDLAVVRRTVQQLAARQEQMTQDIAALQAEQARNRKLAQPAHRRSPPAAMPRPLQSEARAQPPAAPAPAPPPPAPVGVTPALH